MLRISRRFPASARRPILGLGPSRTVSASAQTVPIHEPQQPPPLGSELPVPRVPSRTSLIKDAKPFSSFLTDSFERQHTYLRISITERCNLRCLYCMPEEGVPLSPPEHLLSTAEIIHLAELFVSQGVTKIRLTGGEPTVRKDIVELVTELGKLRSKGLKEICMTSNGIVLARKLPKLVEGGLTGINLSLDTLDPFKFQFMTRRKGLENVLKTIETALQVGVKPLKVNCVVMKGVNDGEIMDFVEMTKSKPIEVRFIEYMPFDGNKWSRGKMIPYAEMLSLIGARYPTFEKVQDHPNDTSKTYKIPGYAGKFGFITSMTHNFCGTCNRLRITSDGNIKVCLFDNAEVSLRDIMRIGNRQQVVKQVHQEGQTLLKEDLQSEKSKMDSDLLNVIGVAVKGKKAKHAGMGNLENMKNRPMILIGPVNKVIGGPNLIRKVMPNIANKNGTFKIYKRMAVHPMGRTESRSIRNLRVAGREKQSKTDRVTRPPNPLPHLTNSGTAHMVDVGNKNETQRRAMADCFVAFTNPKVVGLIESNALAKGDVLAVARIAGIMAAKKTSDIIPLCHPIPITNVEVDITLIKPGDVKSGFENGAAQISAIVQTVGKTGVEMEAMTACAAAGLTVIDMIKKVDLGAEIFSLGVLEKSGGQRGDWSRKHEFLSE